MVGGSARGADCGALTILAPRDAAGQRVDRFLAASFPAFSRARIQALIAGGAVHCGEAALLDAATPVRAGERYSLTPPPPAPARPAPQAIPFPILFEDEELLVLDKPAGLVVHPAPGNQDGTLVNALLAHCGAAFAGIGGEKRPGIVHRLDKDTSGLMLVAKSEVAFRRLQKMIAARAVHRTYDALVQGAPKAGSGTIDRPIGRRPGDRQRFGVVPGGRAAVTHWQLRGALGRESWLRLQLETGRTHQIRVHLQSIGLPVVGDPVYGRDPRGAGQLLHAVRLRLAHPVTGEQISLFAPWPADMLEHLEGLCASQHLDFGEVVGQIGREDS